jgi:hypothetical protein
LIKQGGHLRPGQHNWQLALAGGLAKAIDIAHRFFKEPFEKKSDSV